MIRILIVDDQNLVQQGIKSLLDRDLDFKVIGTVRDGHNAVKQIAQIHPDIVLLDIEMPGMNGITVTKYINRVSPKTKVIILSSHEEKKYVTQALMAGAKGYLLKSSLMNDLKQAILAVNNGYSQIDSRLLAKVFNPENVRAKNNKSDIESKSSKSKNLLNSAIAKNKNILEQKKEQSLNTVHSFESDNSTQSKKTESIGLESKAIVQSKKIELKSPSAKEWAAEKDYFSSDTSDSVVLEKTNEKPDSIESGNSKSKLYSVPNQSNLATTTKKSAREQYRLPRLNNKPRKKKAAAFHYLKKIFNYRKLLTQKSKIHQLKTRISPYKSKLLMLAKQKQKQNLLWSIGLVVLGILVVVVLGNL